MKNWDEAQLRRLFGEATALTATVPLARRFAFLRVCKLVLDLMADDVDVVQRLQAVLAKDVVSNEELYRGVLKEAQDKGVGQRSQLSYPTGIALPVDLAVPVLTSQRGVVNKVHEVLDSLRQRREAIAVLEGGIGEYDKERILAGLKASATLALLAVRDVTPLPPLPYLQMGDAMTAEWGDILGGPLRLRAEAVRVQTCQRPWLRCVLCWGLPVAVRRSWWKSSGK